MRKHRQAEQLWLGGHTDETIQAATGLSEMAVARLSTKLAESPAQLRRTEAIVGSVTDARAVAEVHAWITTNGMPCTPRRWTDKPPVSGLSATTLIARYGSWAKLMRLARVPYEPRPR